MMWCRAVFFFVQSGADFCAERFQNLPECVGRIKMGYFLNSILVKNDGSNDGSFEKIERLYHSLSYKDYEPLKRKKSGKVYDTVSVKYFPLEKNSSFCIYDENNAEIPAFAKSLSCEINVDIVSVQIFDSDELKIQAFRNGKEIAAIYKNHQEYKIDGDVSCLCPDKEKCLSVLSGDYTFIEDCAEKLLPKELVFPEEKIPGQKIVKYSKEVLIPLENERLPEFDTYCWVRPTRESKQFYFSIVNYGRRSKGLLVLLRGSAIENKNVKIQKAYVNTGLLKTRHDNHLQCAEPEIQEDNGVTYLVYRFDAFDFPAGYNKESLATLFKSGNMSLYKKGLEYKAKSVITVSFDCELSVVEGEIEAFAYASENLQGAYAYCKIELCERWQAETT